MNADNAANVDLVSWYMDIPPISRLYLTGAFLTTAACAVDIISPFSLYFNWELVMGGQIWRVLTSYLFFGVFSIDFLFHMYFLVRDISFAVVIKRPYTFVVAQFTMFHPLSGAVQQVARGRRVSRQNRKLCVHAGFRNCVHIGCRFVS